MLGCKADEQEDVDIFNGLNLLILHMPVCSENSPIASLFGSTLTPSLYLTLQFLTSIILGIFRSLPIISPVINHGMLTIMHNN